MGKEGYAKITKRILALINDFALLIIAGYLLGIIGKSLWISLHLWGWLVGFVLTLLYFSLLNSRIGGGQTPGKRVFKIKVVNQKGEYLTLGKSLLRSFIFLLPFFINPC